MVKEKNGNGISEKNGVFESEDKLIFGAAELPMDKFTLREKRIALLLLYAKSRTEIARTIGLSENTVKTHVKHIFKKTGVKSQKELMSKYLFGLNK